MLTAIDLNHWIKALFESSIEEDSLPAMHMLLNDWYQPKVAANEFIDQMAPLYAQKMTRQQMITMTRLARSPEGKMLFQSILPAITVGDFDVFLSLSQQKEQALIKKLKQPDIARAMHQFRLIYADDPPMAPSGFNQFAHNSFARYIKTRFGPLIDNANKVTGQYQPKIDQLDKKVESMSAGIENVLEPENLITREGIKAGRSTLTSFETLAQEYSKIDTEMTQTAYTMQQATLAQMQGTDRDLAAQFVEIGKNRRVAAGKEEADYIARIVSLGRDALDLAENNLGKTRVDGDDLVFDDPVAQTAYDKLSEKVAKEYFIGEKMERKQKRIEDARERAISAME